MLCFFILIEWLLHGQPLINYIATFLLLTCLIQPVNDQSGNSLTDKELVTRVLDGDAHAFGIIVKNTERLVAQIVFKMIPNWEDRKDMAQDVYLKAFRQLKGFRFQSRLSTWIGQIAYFTCLSYLEKKKLVFPGSLHDDATSDDPLDRIAAPSAALMGSEGENILSRKELSGILQDEINKLSPVYKTLIVLYHQEDMSYDEMTQITGLPQGTVKNYLFRARKALKENLSAKYKIDEL